MDSTNVVTFLNTTILIEGGIGSTGVHMTIKTSSGSVTRFVGNFKFYITYVCQPAKTLGIVSLHACITESLISQISPRKPIFKRNHFSLLIRGPDGLDS